MVLRNYVAGERQGDGVRGEGRKGCSLALLFPTLTRPSFVYSL